MTQDASINAAAPTPCNGPMMISLVIPVRNEESSLSGLIASIQRQFRQPDEVILVDGGSTDQTVALARKLTAGDGRYRILEAGEATPGRGRNIGVEATSCEWIAFTDAGIELEPDWLYQLVETAVKNPDAHVVYGNFSTAPSSFFTRCAAMTYAPLGEVVDGWYCHTRSIASSLLRRSVWERVDGFPDWRAGEDLHFMESVDRAGIASVRAPRAMIWWSLSPGWLTTFRRFSNYSFHNVRSGRWRNWHFGVARNYAALLVCALLAIFVHPIWWVILIALHLLRAGRYIWSRRFSRSKVYLFNPMQFLYVIAIMTLVDAAMFSGWGRAILSSK